MSFGSKFSKAFRSVYDATSKSSSKFGKVGKFLHPFSGQYYVRDGWRSLKNRLTPTTSAAGVASTYGSSGSIIGKF